jgi:hypothetical protein
MRKRSYLSLPDGRNQVIFDMDSVVVVSQLIDGAFPDYTPVIPKRHKTRTVMSVADFHKACRTADIFAREASHTARVLIEPGNELNPAGPPSAPLARKRATMWPRWTPSWTATRLRSPSTSNI